MDTVKRKAAQVFTHFVQGYGMVHGNPDADDAKVVTLPQSAVAYLVSEGKIEGEPGDIDDDKDGFQMKPHGIGRYQITGPGLDKPEIIQGKAKAEARLAELNASLDTTANADAPAD